MKILITGGNGMLGRTLRRELADHEIMIADLPEVDVTNGWQIEQVVEGADCDAVIHCAAMTAVDACEEKTDLAYAVNAIGSRNVAIACHRNNARLIAISTDYVFSGRLDRPYNEWDEIDPKSVYGASKLAGEDEIRRHCPDHAILRIAWLYGAGGPSFLHTMLKLGAQEGAPLRVVDDQIGNPTSTSAVAAGVRCVLENKLAGLYHCTCKGEASWYQFTKAIFELSGSSRGLEPCTTAEFPRPAPRPANSRLDNLAFRLSGHDPLPDWREELENFLNEHPQG